MAAAIRLSQQHSCSFGSSSLGGRQRPHDFVQNPIVDDVYQRLHGREPAGTAEGIGQPLQLGLCYSVILADHQVEALVVIRHNLFEVRSSYSNAGETEASRITHQT